LPTEPATLGTVPPSLVESAVVITLDGYTVITVCDFRSVLASVAIQCPQIVESEVFVVVLLKN
jgi:hypothetical protein